MRFRICCEDLRDNLYDPDGKTWGIGLSKYVRWGFQNLSGPTEENDICVLASNCTPLYRIKYCPFCGKQLHLVEELCNHELGRNENRERN